MPKSCVIGDPLQVERLPNGRRVLMRDLEVHVNEHRGWKPITVTKGFDTDYSSIPTLLSWGVRWSRVDIAGVVHDWLYRYGQISRKDADEVWWLVARRGESCANRLQAWLCWLALRGFGVSTWNKYCDRYRKERNYATEEKEPLWTAIPVVVALSVVLCILASLPNLAECVMGVIDRCRGCG